MDSQKHTILVPTDFTNVSDYALEYAVLFAKKLAKEITLLHIIKKDANYQEAEKQIESQADAILQRHGIKPSTIIREGSIFTAIGEVSNELNTEMVIMGTHGRKGVQKFTGMWALKVIVKAKAPFLVVHDFPKKETIDKIVFPVDFKKENIEKIRLASHIAKVFNSKIYIYKASAKVKFLWFIRFNDKGFLKSIFFNMNASEKYFKSNDIPYEIAQARPDKNFSDEIVNYSTELGADLVMITTTKSIDISDYILGASEQSIIDNQAKIPVFCLNPRPRRIGSFSTSGG